MKHNFIINFLLSKNAILAIIFNTLTIYISIKFYAELQLFILDNGNSDAISITHLSILYILSVLFLWLQTILNHYAADNFIERLTQSNFLDIVKYRNSGVISNSALFSSEVPRILYNVLLPLIDVIVKVVYILCLCYFVIDLTNISLSKWHLMIIVIFFIGLLSVFILLIKMQRAIGNAMARITSERLDIVKIAPEFYYLAKFNNISKKLKDRYVYVSSISTKFRTYQTTVSNSIKPLIEIFSALIFIFMLVVLKVPNEQIFILALIAFRVLPLASQTMTSLANFNSHHHALLAFNNDIYKTSNNAAPINIDTDLNVIKISGPSGSGKSTLMDEINKNGINTNTKKYSALDIFYLKTKAPFLDTSAIENLSDKFKFEGSDMYHSLTGAMNTDAENLSTGEKLRLDYLRFLETRSSVLLLDETFSNLNYEMSKKLWDEIMNNSSIELIIFTSHQEIKFINNYYEIEL